MNLIVVHYHLRPGGVRRVIELAVPHIMQRLGGKSGVVTLATGEAPDTAWLQGLLHSLAPMSLEIRTLPAFAYYSEQRKSGEELQRSVRGELCELFDGIDAGDPVVWAHNLGLGRNLVLTRELSRECRARHIPLIAHQHDWWFDNRWQRWPELRRCGFRTLRAVAEAVFPAALNVVHASINREDTTILAKHFPGRVHALPNPVQRVPQPVPGRVDTARRWLHDQIGRVAPVWLLPCRLLRRKNIAEALLLARWLRPEAHVVTLGGVSSADEEQYGAKLAEAARKNGWPLQLGILEGDRRTKLDVAELMAASEAIVLTSIMEGFGLPNVEAAAAARPLIARRLPNVAPDLAEFGFLFPQSYDEVLVAPGLFDWQAEVRRQAGLFRAWWFRLPHSCRKSAGRPVVIACGVTPQPVPFSRLTLTAQLEVLCHRVEDSWNLCAPLNPFLQTWKTRAAAGRLQTTPWPRGASKRLGGPAYAERFAELLNNTPQRVAKPGASLAAQEEFIRERLDATHLFPLLWATET